MLSRTDIPADALPSWGSEVIRTLEPRGEAWVVGGFVRDLLMERTPGDIDIACSLSATDSAALLQAAGFRVIPTGLAHGTITVIASGHPIEITAYRTDGIYADKRHPSSVSPARNISEDLARRDFTMNAIAWHPERGLFDPYGGCEDIEASRIRAVGDPATRFDEDALRILRAVRFAAELGFQLEENTARAATRAASGIEALSAERVFAELTKLLMGEEVTRTLLAYPDIIGAAVPEATPCFTCPQHTKYHSYDVWGHIAHAVGAARPDPLVRWATFLHDIGKPETATSEDGVSHFRGHAAAGVRLSREVAERLKFPTELKEQVALLVKYHDSPVEDNAKSLRRLYGKLGHNADTVYALFDVKTADALAHAPGYRERAIHADRLRRAFTALLAEHAPLRVSDLDISGNEIIALGVPQGPLVGRILVTLFDEVVEETLEPTHDALLCRATELAAEFGA